MFERCLYFNSNALVRHLNRRWDAAYETTGLSAPQAYILRAVHHDPGMSQQQLAQALHLEKSTVTRLVNALVKKQLIQRLPGENLREYQLQATSQGKRLCRKLDSIGEQLYGEMRQLLGTETFDRLVSQLRTTTRKLF